MFQFEYPKLSPVTIRTFYFLICFVFHKKNILKDLYKGRNIFVCETLLWPEIDPPLPIFD